MMCQKGRARERACDSGTEWRLQILSKEGIPEMASITRRGAQSLIPLEILAASADPPAGATHVIIYFCFFPEHSNYVGEPRKIRYPSSTNATPTCPNACLWTVEGIVGENLQVGFKPGTLLLRQLFNI